jgi:hypothetical protein
MVVASIQVANIKLKQLSQLLSLFLGLDRWYEFVNVLVGLNLEQDCVCIKMQ